MILSWTLYIAISFVVGVFRYILYFRGKKNQDRLILISFPLMMAVICVYKMNNNLIPMTLTVIATVVIERIFYKVFSGKGKLSQLKLNFINLKFWGFWKDKARRISLLKTIYQIALTAGLSWAVLAIISLS